MLTFAHPPIKPVKHDSLTISDAGIANINYNICIYRGLIGRMNQLLDWLINLLGYNPINLF